MVLLQSKLLTILANLLSDDFNYLDLFEVNRSSNDLIVICQLFTGWKFHEWIAKDTVVADENKKTRPH